MKNIIFVAFFFTAFVNMKAQSPQVSDKYRDNEWQIGYNSAIISGVVHQGNANIIFNELGSPEVSLGYNPLSYSVANATICDENGNFLFASNGIGIADSSGHFMMGGYPINYGQAWLNHQDGYTTLQGCLILPQPDNSDMYYLFHKFAEYSPNPDWVILERDLRYSKIDMAGNNYKGIVVEKDVSILTDTFQPGTLTACRHANGRDWWITTVDFWLDKMHTFLLDPDGLKGPFLQTVRNKFIGQNDAGDQSVFSPDGTKYAFFDAYAGIHVYDFDRCTGQFSNLRVIDIDSTYYWGGVAFSPNSRYLYVPNYNWVYQYDVQADDITASVDTVATYDNFTWLPNFGTLFCQAQNGPDGKIYISVPGTSIYYHVINNPDVGGVGCGVEQHSLFLPTYNWYSIGNYPNFRLGALDGTSCDSLGYNGSTALADEPVLDFGRQVVGNDTVLYVKFYNHGDDTLHTEIPIITEGCFSTTFPGNFTILPNDSITIPIYFLPMVADTFQGEFIIRHNGTNALTRIRLVGEGIYPISTIAPVPSKGGVLLVFPNPTADVLTISYAEFSSDCTYSLYNMTGVSVLEGSMKAGGDKIHLSLADLPIGVYILTVRDVNGNRVYVKKVVKM